MSVSLYMDVHVPRAITQALRLRGVVYAHQLRVTIGQCVNDLELIANCCDPDDFANTTEFLPL